MEKFSEFNQGLIYFGNFNSILADKSTYVDKVEFIVT